MVVHSGYEAFENTTSLAVYSADNPDVLPDLEDYVQEQVSILVLILSLSVGLCLARETPGQFLNWGGVLQAIAI